MFSVFVALIVILAVVLVALEGRRWTLSPDAFLKHFRSIPAVAAPGRPVLLPAGLTGAALPRNVIADPKSQRLTRTAQSPPPARTAAGIRLRTAAKTDRCARRCDHGWMGEFALTRRRVIWSADAFPRPGRFLLAGLLACCGLVLLFIASFGDPVSEITRPASSIRCHSSTGETGGTGRHNRAASGAAG